MTSIAVIHEIRPKNMKKNLAIILISLAYGLFVAPLLPSNASTVASATTDCKYVNDQGITVFENKCLVYFGSLLQIEGVRKCGWTFYNVHFSSKSIVSIWISNDPKLCSSTVNKKNAKSSYNDNKDYSLKITTDEGELFYLNTNELGM